MNRFLAGAIGAFFCVSAHADERGCKPLESALDLISSRGATYEVHRDAHTLTRALDFYAATPPIGPAPKADGFLWVTLDNLPVVLIFTDGINACEVLRFNSLENAELAKLMIFGRPS